MRNRKIMAVVGAIGALGMVLTACGGNGDTGGAGAQSPAATTPAPSPTDEADGGGGTGGGAAAAGTTLTMAGWDLAKTPEFNALADAFHAANPDIKVDVVEYPAGDDYVTAMTTDIAAGTAPDIVMMKQNTDFIRYDGHNLLLPIDDVVGKLDPNTGSLDVYKGADGNYYAVPFRQDHWVIYYNKDLFKEAGVAEPDGCWTWDDYYKIAEELKAGLPAGVYPIYQHNWQSTIQGFAQAQTPGADLLSGNFEYLAPYYERVMKSQQDGLQPDFGTVTTGSLHHSSEFGLQKAAMVPMGTWFMSQLLAQVKAGEAEQFDWGIAPVPQYDASTTCTDKVPVTFGGPTGMAINARIDPAKIDVAKQFLEFSAGPEGAKTIAGLGLTPALRTPEVVDIIFGTPGMPQDALSKFAFETANVKQENPMAPHVAQVQGILSDLHTAVMPGAVPIQTAIDEAQGRFENEVDVTDRP